MLESGYIDSLYEWQFYGLNLFLVVNYSPPKGGIQGEKNVHCGRFTQGVEGAD
jgi:hypothetical protein